VDGLYPLVVVEGSARGVGDDSIPCKCMLGSDAVDACDRVRRVVGGKC
jgi:hypothetical protein